jgi:transposase
VNVSLLLAYLAALSNPDKRALVEFYEAQIAALRSQIPGRLHFTQTQKARLGLAAFALGRKTLKGLTTLVTPDTLFRWHREAVKHKWDYSRKHGPGRPSTLPEIERLIIQWTQQNPTWGYKRIRDALKNIGHKVSRSTIQNILRKHGIQPAPERRKGMSWSEFFRIHKNVLVGTDFFTWEVLTPFGLVTYYVHFFIRIATREVHIAGITTNPDAPWMMQVARNLTMPDWG